MSLKKFNDFTKVNEEIGDPSQMTGLKYEGIVPRQPNQEELMEIAKCNADMMGGDTEQGNEMASYYHHAVFEGYTSDGPGYSGKVIIGMYGEPNLMTLYTYDKDGVMQCMPFDAEMKTNNG